MKKLVFVSILVFAILATYAGNNKKVLRLGLNNIHTNTQPYDAIIIPGFPYNGESWNTTIKMRLIWAKYLFDNGYAKNIIVSGSSVYSAYNEGEVMALYMEEMGIPRENIIIETRAEHSTENVYYSLKLAEELGLKNVALATDPVQMTFLLRKFMKKEDMKIAKLPVHFGILSKLDHTEPEVDVSCALNDNFVSLVERESRKERMKGTKGLKIERTK